LDENIYILETIESEKRVALKNPSAICGSTTLYFHTDHLGSSNVMSNTSAQNVQEVHYYPYGSTRVQTGGDCINHKFTGQEEDGETAWYYYGARYYDPALGRFTSADSIIPDLTNPQALNRYTYVLDNPLKYIDPTGNYGSDTSSSDSNDYHGRHSSTETTGFTADPSSSANSSISTEVQTFGDHLAEFLSAPMSVWEKRISYSVGGNLGIFGVNWNSNKSTTTTFTLNTPQLGAGVQFCLDISELAPSTPSSGVPRIDFSVGTEYFGLSIDTILSSFCVGLGPSKGLLDINMSKDIKELDWTK